MMKERGRKERKRNEEREREMGEKGKRNVWWKRNVIKQTILHKECKEIPGSVIFEKVRSPSLSLSSKRKGERMKEKEEKE